MLAVQHEVRTVQNKWFEIEISQNTSIVGWENILENVGEEGYYDIAASGWVINPERVQELPFFEPLQEKGDVVVLKRNFGQSKRLFFFFDPFSLATWLSIVVFLISGTFLLFSVEYLEFKKVDRTSSYDVATASGNAIGKEQNQVKKPWRTHFVTTGFMFWYHHMSHDIRIASLSGRIVIISMFFGIFVLHELYLASILDSLINAKQQSDPFQFMDWDSYLYDKTNRLGCPKHWNQCEVDYSPVTVVEISYNGEVLEKT